MIRKLLFFMFFLAVALMALAAVFFYGPERLGVVQPVRGLAVQAVYATGTVEPVVMLPLAPRSNVRLLSLLAGEGQVVEKGQMLARFEDEDLQKALAEAQARVDLAQREYERRSELAALRTIAQEELDRARAALATAQAALGRVQADLYYIHLRAPDEGRIIRQDGKPGELIMAGTPVFWFARDAGLQVTAEVDEEDIALVRQGQSVVIRADAYPDELFSGTVTSITPKGDPIARSYRVRIGLDADTKLLTGMTAETNIIIREQEQALLIPALALENGAVWVVDDNGRAQRRRVETGIMTAHTAQITDGLDTDVPVIASPPAGLQDGQKIYAVAREWTPPR